MSRGDRTAVVAWLVTSVYYFHQYALRSAPAVMMPELSAAFGVSATAVASIAGLFYYGYSPFSLVAGTALDRLGPRKVVPIGAAMVGAGALLFATGQTALASAGRFLQGAGGVFALIGAIYVVTQSFPASRAATLAGATQMFGMAGGTAGQLLVGPMIGAGVPWSSFWIGMGIAGLAIAALLVFLLPGKEAAAGAPAGPGAGRAPEAPGRGDWFQGAMRGLGTVFRNPQSILCGVIAGLLFVPTGIFDMIWGVRYLQEGRAFDYADAVLRSSLVPLGWIVGCPLLGWISDRLGRRKPVIATAGILLAACLGFILYGPADVLPPYVLGFLTGVVSGAAMLPYTVIKEANPQHLGGTATGVVNFINFTFSALLGPVFARLLLRAAADADPMRLEHYQSAFAPMLFGVGLAVVLTFVLKETGTAARARAAVPAESAT